MKGDYDTALKLHKTHLCIAQELSGTAAQGRTMETWAMPTRLGMYDQAVKYHRQELQISMEVNDRASQASTHETRRGLPGTGRPRPGPTALSELLEHRPEPQTSRARRGLATWATSTALEGSTSRLPPYYEQYLRLAPDLQDMEEKGRSATTLAMPITALEITRRR